MKEDIRPAVALSIMLLVYCLLPLMARGQTANPQLQEGLVTEANSFNQQASALYRAGLYNEALPLAEKALALLEKAPEPKQTVLAEALNNLAWLHKAKAHYEYAETLFQRALTIREQALGIEHPDVAQSLNGLAELYRDTGKYTQAEPLVTRALAIREKALGPEHPEVAQSLNNLAVLYLYLGKNKEALSLFNRALAIREKALGPGHPDVAQTLNGLALGQFNREGVELLLNRALKIREKALGPAHPDVAESLLNLGCLYYQRHYYRLAESLWRRALTIDEKALGSQHPSYANVLGWLALGSEAGKNYTKAEQLYHQVLAILEKALGPEHPKVAGVFTRLASLYATQHDYKRAEPQLLRAIAIYEKALGPEHPEVASARNKLAVLYSKTGDYSRAIAEYRKAIALNPQDEKAWQNLAATAIQLRDTTAAREATEKLAAINPDNSELPKFCAAVEPPSVAHQTAANTSVSASKKRFVVAEAYRLQARAKKLFQAGRYKAAETLNQRAVIIVEHALGSDTLEVANTLFSFAQLYLEAGNYADAKPLYERALDTYEKLWGTEPPCEGHWIVNALTILALDYQSSEKYEPAELLLKRAKEIVERKLGTEHISLAVVLNSLGNISQATGRNTEAEQHFKRALAIQEAALGSENVQLTDSLSNLGNLYQETKKYAAAEQFFKRALEIRVKARGPDQPANIAAARAQIEQLMAEADKLTEAGSYPEAISLVKLIVTLCEQLFGPDSREVATQLNRLAGVYTKLGQYDEAGPAYQRALAIAEKVFWPNQSEVALLMNNLANLYYTQKEYTKAEPLYKRVLVIRERTRGARHPDVADVLVDLALLYHAADNLPAAEPLYKRALAIREKAFGASHPAVAEVLNDLAELYLALGNYVSAEPLFKRALAIWKKAHGMEHSAVLHVLGKLAELYREKGNQQVLAKVDELRGKADTLTAEARYNEAETLYQQAAAMVEREIGAEHPHLCLALNGLGRLYLTTGNYAAAKPLFQRALEIGQKSLGPAHPLVATALNNLALLYQATGNYAKAEPLYQRSLTILEKTLGPEHLDVATVLTNLGLLYNAQGDYTHALPILQRALAIAEKAFGPEHPEVAMVFNGLALLYHYTGDYARALPLYQRALAILEKALGPEHPYVATSLNNLGSLYNNTGDYARALPLLQRALAIREKTLGPEHPEVALSLHNLANLYGTQGDYARALPLSQRALAIYEKAFGPEHPEVAMVLNGLAFMYSDTGDYARALPVYQRALPIAEKAFGPEHAHVATLLNNLAALYQKKGDFPQALAFQQRASAVEERNIALVLNAGSQQQKQLYLNIISGETRAHVSLNAQDLPNNADAARLALTVILQRKGRALDVFSDQLAALRQRANPDDQKLLEELAATLTRLANLQLGKDSKLAPEALRTEIARLNADKERLEDAISRRSAEFRALAQPITLDAVQKALPADAALLEFFVYRPFNPKAKFNEQYGAPRYIAYLLKRDASAPQFADLGDAATIDAAAAKFRNALQSSASDVAQVKQLARSLDARLMQPLRKLLGATKRVFLSPDGALNLIPFAALVDENGQYLVENYSFNYLTSGRDLLRLQITGKSESGAALVANPQFDLTQPVVNCKAGQRGLGLLPDTPDAKVDYRGTDFTQYCYSTLAGTAEEATQLGPLLTDAKVLTQKDATEANLKALHRPRLLHIATHGFFFPDQPAAKTDGRGLGFLSDNAPPRPVNQENPLLRSGLILAGVNQRQSGPDNDGVLTALETAGLDLFGTKLVVLSACETGLGEVQNGQGVYGLRRALVLAGSETQVMSLWKVSDAATRDLMVAYYTRLQRGEGRSEAMRQVQLELLKNGKLATPADGARKVEQEADKTKPATAQDWRHPYFWASFTQSGAWTNLDGK